MTRLHRTLVPIAALAILAACTHQIESTGGATPKPMLTLEVGAVAPDGLGRFVKLRERASLAIVAGFQIDKLVALAAAGS